MAVGTCIGFWTFDSKQWKINWIPDSLAEIPMALFSSNVMINEI